MFKKISLFLSTLLLAIGPIFALDPTTGLNYITENFPPFNYHDTKTNTATGINTDILIAMFKEMGSTKNYSDIKIVSWPQGYETLQDPKASNVLFSTARTPAREGLFKWVGPLTDGTHAILVLNENAARMKIKTPADFKKYKFAAIRDDLGDLKLKEAGVPEKNINYYAAFDPMVEDLLAKHIDAISYGDLISSLWLLKEDDYDIDSFQVIYSVIAGHHYFAFNKNIEDYVVQAHQVALDKLKADPVFMEKVESKYLK